MTRPIFCLLPFEYSRKRALRIDVEALDQRRLVGPVHPAAKVREVLQGLATGQAVVEGELAGDVADASMDRDRIGARLDAEDERAAAGRADQVEEGPDGRRLAGTVGAEEAEDLALADLEVDVDDAEVAAVVLGELLGLDDGRHARSFALAGFVSRTTVAMSPRRMSGTTPGTPRIRSNASA